MKTVFQFAALLAIAAAPLAMPVSAHAQSATTDGGSLNNNVRVYRDGPAWVEETKATFSGPNKYLKLQSDMGSVNITGGQGEDITVIGRKIIRKASSEADARRQFEAFAIETARKAGTVFVEGSMTGGRMRHANIEYTITVPRGLEMAKAETNGGSIGIATIAGKAIAETAGGSIEFDNIGGPVYGSTSGGSISVTDVGGDAKLETAGGSINIGNVKGKVYASTAGGSIDLGTCTADAVLETAGGSINVRKTGGPLRASTMGGSIEVGDINGEVTLETAGGHIKVGSAKGNVRAETAGGGIHVMRVTHGANLETAAGDIEVWFLTDRNTFTPSRLETTNGNVVVYLPPDLPVTVKAWIELSNGHKIYSDFPGINIKQSSGYGPREWWGEGALNGGGPELKLHTLSGNIEIKRARNQ